MKNHTCSVLCFMLSGWFATGCFCQTYVATYEVLLHHTEAMKPTSGKADELTALPLAVTMRYEITANKRYMRAKGAVTGQSSEQLALQVNKSEAIFDFRKGLVYFPATEQIQRLQPYRLSKKTKEKNGCNRHRLKDLDERYQVLICRNIPAVIMPAFQLSNAGGGISEVSTPTFVLRLESFDISSEELDFSALFELLGDKMITGTYRFL